MHRAPLVILLLALSLVSEKAVAQEPRQQGQGLHGYIGYRATRPPTGASFGAGVGFYAAVFTLIDRPYAGLQIGLPSNWIIPDNSDNKDKPLAPVGTLARDNWPERGPTYGSVFQTLEGGLGYWARSRFRYGPPKFSMNATPQCYDYEIGSPGWSFFYDTRSLPDNRLGVAQLSNRILIPPDALPFDGEQDGKLLGYSYMALPFTDPVEGAPPTGDQSWTCFLSAENFKGPIAYYIPETWSKIGALFDYPFIYGRGLDSRPGHARGGAMEINTVPRIEVTGDDGTVWSKIPQLRFPVNEEGKSLLVQDVTHYSKAALFDAVQTWRKGGPAASGLFDETGAFRSKLTPNPLRFRQAKQQIQGMPEVFDTIVTDDNVWGLTWKDSDVTAPGLFPQYYKQIGEHRVLVPASEVPKETGLHEARFRLAKKGQPFTSRETPAWTQPGPVRGPFQVQLTDGSLVTYSWYRFVDQPSFRQYAWSEEKRKRLQAFVEKMHAHWTIDRHYMPPPSSGKLASLDPALLVTPPKGLEVGHVPIVTRQEAAR